MEKKLTVMEASKLLGVSKEAIYNRLRRGTLNCVIEEGTKYILLGKQTQKDHHHISTHIRKNEPSIDNAYVTLLKEQLEELKAKNTRLELDKERLIADKERFLIESKEKIERIYKERDEQLKTILSLANHRQIVHTPSPSATEHDYVVEDDVIIPSEEEAEEADVIHENQHEEELLAYSDWRDLRNYLKEKGFAKKEKNFKDEALKKQMMDLDESMEKDGMLFVRKSKKFNEILGD